MRMQFLLFLCRPHNLRILQHKRRITVTTIVEGLKNKVLQKCLQTRFSKMSKPQKDYDSRNWWEVWFGQQFIRYIEFISLNVRMLPLYYRYVIIYAYYKQIMILQKRIVTLFHDYQSIFYLLNGVGQFEK